MAAPLPSCIGGDGVAALSVPRATAGFMDGPRRAAGADRCGCWLLACLPGTAAACRVRGGSQASSPSAQSTGAKALAGYCQAKSAAEASLVHSTSAFAVDAPNAGL